jgi:hypothetical protein
MTDMDLLLTERHVPHKSWLRVMADMAGPVSTHLHPII